MYVLYAVLDSTHKKIRRMGKEVDLKPGGIERQVDPNTNLPSLIYSNVELDMCRI